MPKTVLFFLFAAALHFGCNSTPPSKTQAPSEPTSTSAPKDYMGAYAINDATFGTKTTVTIEGEKRQMVTNGLPNHKTGEFPNAGNPNKISAQDLKYSFPINPVFTGKAKWAREPGVALNGVKLEPETAEAFICETGERYRIEAFQSLVDLGLDQNHAHVQPTGAYHYHGVPTGLVALLDKGEDIIHIGFAHDGYPIYYSKSGKYKPSYQLVKTSRTGDICTYRSPTSEMKKELKGTSPDGTFVSDWEYVKGLGQLDQCNGVTLDGKYVYFATDDYPYLGRCLMGEFTQSGPPGGGKPGDRPKGPPPGGKGGHGHEHPHN
jgi:hypothetical protein